jgi:hypothetical protein
MQKPNTPLQQLLQKEMSRKEFIATLGFGAASLFGFSSLITMLNGFNTKQHKVAAGYGSSSYGGATGQKV